MKTTKYITRAAVILALTIALQLALRAIIPEGINVWIVGSIVNLGLLLAVETTGLWAGTLVAIATPITAYLQQHLPSPIMIPAVMAGNLVLVILFWLAVRKSTNKTWMRWLGLLVGAAAKMAFLYFVMRLLLNTSVKLPPAKVAIILTSFSFPQFITAVIGGILASLIASRIKPLTAEK